MKSGGQTKVTDIGVGRQLLCNEKPNGCATSKCAKKLKSTVEAAKKGMTSKQQTLWQKYVYAPALVQAQKFCQAYKPAVVIDPWSDDDPPARSKAEDYKICVERVLAGTEKIIGLLGKKFKWSDYLVDGAKVIKRLPATSIPGLGTQSNH